MKAKKKKRKKVQLSPAVVETNLCALLAGKPDLEFSKKVGAFPYDLKVVRADNVTAPVILIVKDQTASIISGKYVAALLRDYVSYLSGALESYNITFQKCLMVVESWVHQTVDLTSLPKAVAFKSDPELCLTRLAFDPEPVDPEILTQVAPIFTEMLARISTNAEAFCMRIGSLFDPKADRKQAIWMSGPADCGKSQFSWLVGVLTGESYAILSHAALKKDYWKASLVGRRVALVHEAVADFIRTDEFKSITGDDDHSVNQKFIPAFNSRIDSIFFFFSNQEPEIPNDDALLNRIIDCRISPVAVESRLPKEVIRERLGGELPYIAGYCMSRYATISTGGRIPTTSEALHNTVSNFEAEYLDFLEHHFIKDALAHIFRSRFKELMVEWGILNSINQSTCKKTLLSTMGVKQVRRVFKSNTPETEKKLFVYEGIRERSEKEKQFLGDVSEHGSHVSRIGSQHIKIIR